MTDEVANALAFVPNQLVEHQTAIGSLCMGWAFVDRELNYLIQAMLDSTYDDAHAIGTSLDSVAGRCNLLRDLASMHAPSNEWRAQLRRLLSHVQGPMASKRNRIVHDHWIPSGTTDVAFKMNRQLKTEVDAKGEVKRIFYDTIEEMTLVEILMFNRDVLQAGIAISAAARDMRRFKAEGKFEDTSWFLTSDFGFLSEDHLKKK